MGRRLNIRKDIERFVIPDPGHGILNVCMCAWLPEETEGEVSMGFGIQTPDEKGRYASDVDFSLMCESDAGRLLPNQNYLTLSRVDDGRMCRAGFPLQVCMPGIGTVPGQFALYFFVEIETVFTAYRIKTKITGFDEAHPYATISAAIDPITADDNSHSGIVVKTYKGIDCGWNVKDYVIDSPFAYCKRDPRTYTDLSPKDRYHGGIRTSISGDDCIFTDADEEIVTYGMSWEKAISDFMI